MDKFKVLVIDDEESIRTQMKWGLVNEYDVLLATDAESALKALKKESPVLVTLDLGLPPSPEDTVEGLRLLDEILSVSPSAKVVVVTGNPDKTAALEAVGRGAYDFLTKPIDLVELRHILKRASYIHSIETEYRSLQERVRHGDFAEMIGTSPRIQEIFAKTRKVATTDMPVLIMGESGTGKELVARAVHTNSARAQSPFVVINCGAIPEALLESEIFGHEKGSFTGAHVQRKGKAELANGGTLFLDEIGEMPLQLQVKLLRFLQDHKIERVGGREPILLDVRIVAATNKDLKKMVSEGRFREDLYFRLAVITLELPPLRARGEDAVLLARSFLKKYSDQGGPKALSKQALDAILSYSWPGNIRELENRIRSAITFAEGNSITPGDMGIGSSPAERPAISLNLKKAKDELAVRLIQTAIDRCEGNMSRAAEELGLTRPTLYNLMKKYRLQEYIK